MSRFVLLCAALLLWVAVPTSAEWADNFDSYTAGTQLYHVGGWSGWDDVSTVVGEVSADYALSAPHSIKVNDGADDAVNPMNGPYTSGQWTWIGYQYIPKGLTSVTYFIIQNVYQHGGPYDWAIETHMDPVSGLVWDQIRDPGLSQATAIVFDKWVEMKAVIDLDKNYVEQFYGGKLISAGAWNAYSGGPIQIANLDLFSPTFEPVYWDDLALIPEPASLLLLGLAGLALRRR